jgi:hypothetical protein
VVLVAAIETVVLAGCRSTGRCFEVFGLGRVLAVKFVAHPRSTATIKVSESVLPDMVDFELEQCSTGVETIFQEQSTLKNTFRE